MWQTSDISADWLQGKHVYVGEDRIATKYNSEGNDNTQAERERTYYYHSDHLGSAQTVTNWKGQVHERLEYTPYGELWIDWKNADAPEDSTPFRFTGKEQDPETGLYYYGARYLDPKTSRWLSGDPALGEYLPVAPLGDEEKKRNQNLPGMGGVFNTVNMHAYHYAGNNPVKYVDPDGELMGMPADVKRVLEERNANVDDPTQNVQNNRNDVIAIRGGTVFRSGWQNADNHDEGMGWRISIDRGDGYYDQYGHLDPTSTLPVGTQVNEGDVVGRMADPTNGHSTGPHVHFETRENSGVPVDPGTASPFRGPSRVRSPYQAQEPGLRVAPHSGVDHVPE
jgi:RHS repeat-associated protein